MITQTLSRVRVQLWRQLLRLGKISWLRKTWFWFQARPRRIRILRRWAIVLLLLLVARFTEPTIANHFKGWQARRLAHQASDFIEKRDWVAADKKVRDAISLRRSEPDVWFAVARLFSRTEQSADAVEWWRKIEAARPLGPADRRDYAAAALAISDLDTASEQIHLLTSQSSGPSPKDLLLAGELAVAEGHADSAIRYAKKILDDSKAASDDSLEAAALVFRNANPDDPSRKQACDHLTALARGPSDSAALGALTLLAKQSLTSPVSTTVFNSSTSPPDLCNGTITVREIVERLEKHPDARGYHRILAYDLKVRLDPSRRDEFVTEAINSFSHGDDETLVALGGWLYGQRHFEDELRVISADRAATRRELFCERLDALTALGRGAEAENLLLGEYSVLDQTSQHMYLAVIRSRSGEGVASVNEWERALDSADSVRDLLTLANYAERNGAIEIAEDAYERLTIKQSNLRSAYLAELRLAESMDQTAKAQTIAAKIVQLWPQDITSQMHETYLRLLLGVSKADAQTAERDAAAFLEHNPRHLGARMVLALARLKLGRRADALEAVTETAGGDQPSNVPPMAVRAAALAANGWKDKGLEEAQRLASVKLLPEERALIASVASGTN